MREDAPEEPQRVRVPIERVYVSMAEAARVCHVHRNTITNWVRSGFLTVYKQPPDGAYLVGRGRRRLNLGELLAWQQWHSVVMPPALHEPLGVNPDDHSAAAEELRRRVQAVAAWFTFYRAHFLALPPEDPDRKKFSELMNSARRLYKQMTGHGLRAWPVEAEDQNIEQQEIAEDYNFAAGLLWSKPGKGRRYMARALRAMAERAEEEGSTTAAAFARETAGKWERFWGAEAVQGQDDEAEFLRLWETFAGSGQPIANIRDKRRRRTLLQILRAMEKLQDTTGIGPTGRMVVYGFWKDVAREAGVSVRTVHYCKSRYRLDARMKIVASTAQHAQERTDGMLGEGGRERQTGQTVEEIQAGEAQGEREDGKTASEGKVAWASPEAKALDALRVLASDLAVGEALNGWSRARALLERIGFSETEASGLVEARDVVGLLEAVEKIKAAGK